MNLTTFLLLFTAALSFANNSVFAAKNDLRRQGKSLHATDADIVINEDGEAVLELKNGVQLVGAEKEIKAISGNVELMQILNCRFQDLTGTQALTALKMMAKISAKLGLASGNAVLNQLIKIASNVGKEMDQRLRKDWAKLQRQYPWMWSFEKEEEAAHA